MFHGNKMFTGEIKCLLVNYRCNKNVSKTVEMFKEYLCIWDVTLQEKNYLIGLVLDNYVAHPHNSTYQHWICILTSQHDLHHSTKGLSKLGNLCIAWKLCKWTLKPPPYVWSSDKITSFDGPNTTLEAWDKVNKRCIKKTINKLSAHQKTKLLMKRWMLG